MSWSGSCAPTRVNRDHQIGAHLPSARRNPNCALLSTSKRSTPRPGARPARVALPMRLARARRSAPRSPCRPAPDRRASSTLRADPDLSAITSPSCAVPAGSQSWVLPRASRRGASAAAARGWLADVSSASLSFGNSEPARTHHLFARRLNWRVRHR